jgi:hypothetical protein
MSENESHAGPGVQREGRANNRGGEEKKRVVRVDMLLTGAILIAIGALLLTATLNPDLNFRDLIMTYWPVLLIAAGLVKIVQAAMGISGAGSGFGLLITVVIILIVVAGVPWDWIDYNGWFWFGPDSVYSESIELAPGRTLEIRSVRADTRLYGHNGDDVRLRVSTYVSGWNRKEAKEIAEDYKAAVTRTEAGALIVADAERASDGRRRVRIRMEIGVPRNLLARITAQRADVDLESVDGELDINIEYGDLDVRRSSGKLTLSTQSGEVDFYDYTGDVRINGGRTDIDLEGVYGAISVDIERGSIDLENYRTVAGDIDISTGRGNVEFEADGESDFELDARAPNGHVNCEFGELDISRVKELRHTFNAGTHKVTLVTERGMVAIDSH